MEDTIRFALELDPDLANFMIAAPYPGTELWEIARRDGRLFSMDWRDYAIHDEKARYELPTLAARAGGAQVARGLSPLLPAAQPHLAQGNRP